MMPPGTDREFSTMNLPSPTNVLPSNFLYFPFPTSKVKYVAAITHHFSHQEGTLAPREIRTGQSEWQVALDEVAGEYPPHGIAAVVSAVVFEREIIFTVSCFLFIWATGWRTESSSVLERTISDHGD